MINIPKKLRPERMRSYTPHVGNKLKRTYDEPYYLPYYTMRMLLLHELHRKNWLVVCLICLGVN